MSRTVNQILDEAMQLTAEDRLKMAEQLLRSVDGLDREQMDAAWASIAEDRLRRYEAGQSSAIALEDAVGEIRNLIRAPKP